MKVSAKLSLVALTLGCLVGDPFVARANDLYVAQTALGLANGQDCANAKDTAYFNTASIWVSSSPIATQVGPGTTVHLCGVFNASAGASGYLNIQGSGSNGNPITVLFEPGAVLQAPYWGTNGAITASGRNYLIIDGGTNGVIQATANGTNFTNRQNGVGVLVTNCNNCEVRNLTVANMYVHAFNPGDSNGGSSYAIRYVNGSNISIHHNTLHDSSWCAFYAYTTTPVNVSIHHNTIYNCNGSIVVGSGLTGATVNGVLVYRNTIHDSANWDDAADNNHHDAIHLWAVHPNSVWSNVQIFNNYAYGDWGIHTTALVFIEANGGGAGSGTNGIYNNVFVASNSAADPPANGDISLQGDGWFVLNNAFINDSNAGGGGGAVQADSGNNVTMENNVMVSPSTAFNFPAGTSIYMGDHNDYYNVGNVVPFFYGGSTYNTLAAFAAASGSEQGSITDNPNLSSAGVPAAGSVVIGAGVNRTFFCGTFTALCLDAAGHQRPATGPWDIGAFQFSATPVVLAPPTQVIGTAVTGTP
jgi:hypothetical protein